MTPISIISQTLFKTRLHPFSNYLFTPSVYVVVAKSAVVCQYLMNEYALSAETPGHLWKYSISHHVILIDTRKQNIKWALYNIEINQSRQICSNNDGMTILNCNTLRNANHRISNQTEYHRISYQTVWHFHFWTHLGYSCGRWLCVWYHVT